MTEKGEAFISHANEIMKATNMAISFAIDTNVPDGILRIGSVDSLATAILPDLLFQFHRTCPKVETIIKTGMSDDLIDMIKSNDIDLFLTLDHKIYGSEWVRAMQRKEDIVFVTSRNNPLACDKKIDLQTIIDQPFLLTEKGESYRYGLESILSEQDIYIKPILEIGNTETIIHLLEKGMGVSFLPFFSVQGAIHEGRLSQIQTDIHSIQMWSQLLYHKNKWITPQMNAFISVVQEFFKKE